MTKAKSKRLLSLLLAVAMLFSVSVTPVLAADTNVIDTVEYTANTVASGESTQTEDSVASVTIDGTTTYYTSVSEAIGAVTDTATVVILQECETDITVANGITITLDLQTDYHGDITIESGGTLTFNSTYDMMGGSVTVNGTLIVAKGGVGTTTVNNGGVMTVSGGAAQYKTTVNEGGTLTVSSGSVNELTVAGGTATISGGSVSEATVTSGTLTVSSGTVSTTTFNVTGGTVNVTGGTLTVGDELKISGGTVNVSGGTIGTSSAQAAITVSDGVLNVSDGAVNGTIALTGSGSVTISGGTVTTNSSTLENSITVASSATGTLTITGGTVTNNSKMSDDDKNTTAVSVESESATVTVTGGTFSSDVKSYTSGTVTDNGDGTYTVTTTTYVATVTDSNGDVTSYTTLAAAAEYANTAAASASNSTTTTTITLLDNVTLTEKITLTNTSSKLTNYLVLDLNGKTITGNVANDYVIYIGASNSNGYVTVKNGTINAGSTAYGAIQVDCENVQLDTLTLSSQMAGHGTLLINAVKGNSTYPSTLTDITINTVDGACLETATGTVVNQTILYINGTNTFTQTMSEGTAASVASKSAAVYLDTCGTILRVNSTATVNWTSAGYGVYFAGGVSTTKMPKIQMYGGGKIDGELGGVYIGSGMPSNATLTFYVYSGSTIAVDGGLTSEASISNGGYDIYDGSYEYDLDDSYVPSGYECVLDTDSTSDTYGRYIINTVILAQVYNGNTLIGEYNSLSGAISAASDGYTVKLVKDITLSSYISITKKVTIDMNGHDITYSSSVTSTNYIFALNTTGSQNTLTLTNSQSTGGNITNNSTFDSSSSKLDLVVYVARGNLVVEDGVTLTSTNGYAVYVGGFSTASYNNGTIQATATINGGTVSGGVAGVVMWGDQKNATSYGPVLTVNGGTISGGNYGISGNGTSGYGPTFIYIEGGTISGNTAIFHPQQGTIKVSGDNTAINGTEAGIQMCSGNLTVSGGTITVTGGGDTSNKTGDGAIPDGAAVSIVNRSYPGGTPTATITGGIFKSATNVAAVQAYTWSSNTYSDWDEAGDYVNISGGHFTTKVLEAYCAEGYEPYTEDVGTIYDTNGYPYTVGGLLGIMEDGTDTTHVVPATVETGEGEATMYVKVSASYIAANYSTDAYPTTTLTYTDDDGAHNYIFAGWYYLDESSAYQYCSSDMWGEDGLTETYYYAKFVDANVMTVGFQYAYTSGESTDTTIYLRLISTVDSLNYDEAGFVVQFSTGKNSHELAVDIVYKAIYGMTEAYTPDMFSGASTDGYFTTYVISGVPVNDGVSITVYAYWKTMDGTKVVSSLTETYSGKDMTDGLLISTIVNGDEVTDDEPVETTTVSE